MARADARTALRVVQMAFRLQCHETYIHVERVRGGEIRETKRTRVIWERTFSVTDNAMNIDTRHPGVFTKDLELPRSIRVSSHGAPPYHTWFLASIITAHRRGKPAATAEAIVNEVSVSVVNESVSGGGGAGARASLLRM
eukprot:CAMPEP_0170197326 /NCGR_PEP_ID=MMETSP0040_2-20121228/66130_1 /TAXON_ID=641309 /ORGANISM="Lotharella oceanica, Strain CCMP622" /LENGTH=139 /DNA_ID=CAMNT_0010446969 /DNA_START=48 /DNA_END=467 /DNA_ORIENTATION=-